MLDVTRRMTAAPEQPRGHGFVRGFETSTDFDMLKACASVSWLEELNS